MKKYRMLVRTYSNGCFGFKAIVIPAYSSKQAKAYCKIKYGQFIECKLIKEAQNGNK